MVVPDILNVLARAQFDNSITSAEYHRHQPYITGALGLNDEIRIPIQNQDLYVNIHDSYLYLEGKVTKGTGATDAPTPITNAFAHLFEQVAYYLNGQIVDKTRSVGHASTMKGYVTFNETEAKTYWNYGGSLITTDGRFSACLPLKTLLGFAERYNKIILNGKHELVLLRTKSDDSAFVATVSPEVNLTKVEWMVPYIKVNHLEHASLLKISASPKSVIEMPFQSWELFQNPMQQTTKQSWTIKTATEMEKPRYIILGFQAGRNQSNKDSSKFDHCNVTNVKLYLNSEQFPYTNMEIEFNQNQFEDIYYKFIKFQETYLSREAMPLFDRAKFKSKAPLIVIDCSKQVESISNVSVDVRLEVECSQPFAENTIAYALILHDRLVEYSPHTKLVKTLA